jgi:hypothetical protein
MIEIIITMIIVFFAGFIIVNSLKNSSKGKCNCGCNGCKSQNICSGKNKITIK